MKIPEELINRATANALKGAMDESEKTQQELADDAGMSRVTVQKLLSGNQSIKISQFLNLTEATELSPAEVMNRVEAAVARKLAMSDAPISLANHRQQKKKSVADMTDEELEAITEKAAIYDPELEQDEPDLP